MLRFGKKTNTHVDAETAESWTVARPSHDLHPMVTENQKKVPGITVNIRCQDGDIMRLWCSLPRWSFRDREQAGQWLLEGSQTAVAQRIISDVIAEGGIAANPFMGDSEGTCWPLQHWSRLIRRGNTSSKTLPSILQSGTDRLVILAVETTI